MKDQHRNKVIPIRVSEDEFARLKAMYNASQDPSKPNTFSKWVYVVLISLLSYHD